MTVEWVGGPKDGQQFAVPDGSRFIEVVRHTHQLTMEGGLYDQNDVMLIEIVEQRNGRRFVHWREI